MNKTIEDIELGVITLRKNFRSRNYTIRVSRGNILVTLPILGTYKRALEFVYEHKEQLVKKLNESKAKALPEVDITELRKKAKAYLPGKLQQLSMQNGFTYTSVRITKSRTRWGSCSSKATINLSLFLMLLPEHLIDYVLLHELCHTVHMNHGPEFWQLLNSKTDSNAKKFRKELKNYRLF